MAVECSRRLVQHMRNSADQIFVGPLVNVINYAEFFVYLLRGFDFVGVEICLFP